MFFQHFLSKISTSKTIKPIYLDSLYFMLIILICILYRLSYETLSLELFSVQMSKWLSFCRKFLLLCRLKTFILLKFMIIQLFARYSKLTTYMSVAAISSDILIYAFFQSGSLGRCSLYFSMCDCIMEPFL